MIEITAPEQSPVDESIEISINGLQQKQRITIRIDAVKNDVTMSSFAKFEASENGVIDLTKDRSLGGSYVGIEPMGLFWSMEMTSRSVVAFKMLVGRVDSWPCSIQVFDDHSSSFKELSEQKPVAERTIQRMFVCDGVRRSDVRFNTLRGFLFLPNNKTNPGPYPAVIDIYGSTNLVAHRAALMARHGYAVLAVAFGGYDDLPMKADYADLGYFAQAVEFLKLQPEVDGNRIGTIGNCLGGTFALSIALEFPEIRAIAACSPEPVAEDVDYKFPKSGTFVKSIKLLTEPYEEGGRTYKRLLQKKSVIEAGGSLDSWRQFCFNYGRIKDAPILMFYGAGDTFFDLDFAIPCIRQQMADEGKTNYELVSYRGAGHIFQPCHLPVYNCYYSPLFGGLLKYGGELPYHARAQSDMWTRCLAFFKSHLKDAHPDEYSSGPRPVNVRRDGNGKMVDSSDINCQYNYVDFDSKDNSFPSI